MEKKPGGSYLYNGAPVKIKERTTKNMALISINIGDVDEEKKVFISDLQIDPKSPN